MDNTTLYYAAGAALLTAICAAHPTVRLYVARFFEGLVKFYNDYKQESSDVDPK